MKCAAGVGMHVVHMTAYVSSSVAAICIIFLPAAVIKCHLHIL